MQKTQPVLKAEILGAFCLIFSLHCALTYAQGASPAKKPAPAPGFFDRNLLKNGSAEAPTSDNHKVPGGWQLMEEFTVAEYGSVSGEWDWGLTGCTGCGKYYLRLQFQDKKEIASSQTVDVSAAADAIDAGNVDATIQAFLGGFLESDTTSLIKASFHDSKGSELGSIETDPMDMTKLPKASSGSTGLSPCEKSGAVPAGTRTIIFTWTAKASGDSNAYIALGDNFSLVLKRRE